MGSTSQPIIDGQTVRGILTQTYEGDPLACASCAWHEAAHPRVTGSEYDSIYGPRPETERPEPHPFAPTIPRYRVLDYSMVALSEVYMAVETIETGEVWAGVAIVHMTRGGMDSYPQVTYKDMSETMGPGIDRCPARILDRLTATTDAYALEWRAACRKRLAERSARPKVGAGTRIRFASPLKFTNGDELDTFEMVSGSTFRAVHEWGIGSRYTIGSWRERPYSLA